jgi:hypothetical protein
VVNTNNGRKNDLENDLENDLPRLVLALSDPNPAARETAAAEIFARGCEFARSAVQQWLVDEELARNFLTGSSHEPQETVGLAVEPDNFERIRSAFGSPPLADVPSGQDALEFEIEYPIGVRLDILTTNRPTGSGAIARFLQKFGEGIQQVELLVQSVDTATQILRARFGIVPVYPAARAGANATLVNFFLAPAAGGGKVLIELVQTSGSEAIPRSL